MAFADTTEIFDAPLEKVLKVISDYESYPEFMDGVSDVKILDRNGDNVRAEYSINIIKKFKYILNLKSTANSVSWTFESGDLFNVNSGTWTLEALSENKTKAVYTLEADFKVKVPGMISRKLVSSNLPSMMKAVHKRAKSL